MLAGNLTASIDTLESMADKSPNDARIERDLACVRLFTAHVTAEMVKRDFALSFPKGMEWVQQSKIPKVPAKLLGYLTKGEKVIALLKRLRNASFDSLWFIGTLFQKGLAVEADASASPMQPAAGSDSQNSEVSENQEDKITHKEKSMARLDDICKGVVDAVDDALAVGVVDLETGMLMGVNHTINYFTQAYLDAVSAAAVELFRGKMVRRVEELLSKHRGTDVKDSFQEVFVKSTTVYHFMIGIPEKSAVVVLVTKKTANQGLGWSSLRNSLEDIKAGLP